MDPLHITEFASERYFEKLRRLNESNENASSAGAATAAAATTAVPTEPPLLEGPTFTLPLGRQRSLDNDTVPLALRPSDQKKRSLGHDLTALRTQRRPTFSGSFGALRSKVTVTHKAPSVVEHHEDVLAEDPTVPHMCVHPLSYEITTYTDPNIVALRCRTSYLRCLMSSKHKSLHPFRYIRFSPCDWSPSHFTR
jgi:hypothetical protein